MNNYEFCAQWIVDQKPDKNVSILDYGCGSGGIVKELRKLNFNAFGCDIFYEGGDYSKSITTELFDGGVIKRMDGDTIPFGDAWFDFIVNNQVMEHVENLDTVLTEIQRVLKPGGFILSLFPEKGVWIEGHCSIPFLHWFPNNSQTRVYYAAGFRFFGIGYHKCSKSVMQWSQDFCEWIDKWTYYRTQQEIHSTFHKYFCEIKHIEDYWLQLRKPVFGWLPTSIQRLVVNKFAGVVIVARKPI